MGLLTAAQFSTRAEIRFSTRADPSSLTVRLVATDTPLVFPHLPFLVRLARPVLALPQALHLPLLLRQARHLVPALLPQSAQLLPHRLALLQASAHRLAFLMAQAQQLAPPLE